jgi:hypothetical protein
MPDCRRCGAPSHNTTPDGVRWRVVDVVYDGTTRALHTVLCDPCLDILDRALDAALRPVGAAAA